MFASEPASCCQSVYASEANNQETPEMRPKSLMLSLAFTSLVLLATSASVIAATISIPQTGSSGANDPVTDGWDIIISGAGTLEITLVQADYSEYFQWNLTGSQSGSGEFSPLPYVGVSNTSLGSWANNAPGASYSFTATNYPATGFPGFPIDYTLDFSFTYDELDGLNPPDRIIVTPNAVPLPAAVYVFAPALLGALGLTRRKTQG
tara:strand:+ start:37 stop:657 length:621 start_codon:yes stop_codon:yes gene_type:complete